MDILKRFREVPNRLESPQGSGVQVRRLPQVAPSPRGGRVVVGLDLGRQQDYTALAVVQRERREDRTHFIVRGLERLALGTPYPVQVDRVAEVVEALKQRSASEDGGGFRVDLVVDLTGVGVAVGDLLRERRVPYTGVTIVSGDGAVEKHDGRISVGKAYLIGRLQVALQTERLHLPDVPEADVLERELQDYQGHYTAAGNRTFDARSGRHDDLVLAVALAVAIDPVDRLGGGFVGVRKTSSRW